MAMTWRDDMAASERREHAEHVRAVAVGAEGMSPAEAYEAALMVADRERDLEREELTDE